MATSKRKQNDKPLTDTRIKTLKAAFIADVYPYRGLRYIKRPKGGTWTYRYKAHNGKLKQIKLGNYPAMSLAAARQEYNDFKKLRDKGGDPRVAREAIRRETVNKAKADKQKQYTVERMCSDYLDEHVDVKRGHKAATEAHRLIKKDVLPVLGAIPSVNLTVNDVHDMVQSIIKRGAPVVAGSAMRELRAAFEHGVKAGRIKPDTLPNPCARVDAPTNGKRTRVFRDGELSTFLKWLRVCDMSNNARDVLHLVLLTGVRSGEAVAATWKHIDLDRGVWVLPTTKTGISRNVQLSRQAAALLKARKEVNKTYVFPSQHTSERISQNAVVQAVINHRGSSGLEDWAAHDLRRSVRTGLARLQCPPVVAEAVLGHTRKGVEGIYDLHRYEGECREWLQRWADHLDTLAKAKNVVAFKQEVSQ